MTSQAAVLLPGSTPVYGTPGNDTIAATAEFQALYGCAGDDVLSSSLRGPVAEEPAALFDASEVVALAAGELRKEAVIQVIQHTQMQMAADETERTRDRNDRHSDLAGYDSRDCRTTAFVRDVREPDACACTHRLDVQLHHATYTHAPVIDRTGLGFGVSHEIGKVLYGQGRIDH